MERSQKKRSNLKSIAGKSWIFPSSQFSPRVSTVNGVPWPQESGRRNSHTFNCRMLKRPPDEVDSENPEARQQYEIMQCLTVSQPRSVQEEGEGAWSTHVCALFHLFSYITEIPEFWMEPWPKHIWKYLVDLISKNVFGNDFVQFALWQSQWAF